MIGVCGNWRWEKALGGILYGTGKRASIFVHFSEVEEDNLGRRYLLLGEEVEFEIGFLEGSTYPCPKNVRVLSPRETEDPDTYWEEGIVDKLLKQFGAYIHRPCGGWLFLHKEAAKSKDAFAIGQVWRYQVKPPHDPTTGLNWVAVNAEFLGYESKQEDFPEGENALPAGKAARGGKIEMAKFGLFVGVQTTPIQQYEGDYMKKEGDFVLILKKSTVPAILDTQVATIHLDKNQSVKQIN